MTRPVTLTSQIFGSFDDTGPKELLPDPVHKDTGCQGVLSINQPPRQVETSQALSLRNRRERFRQPRVHFLTFVIILPPLENKRLPIHFIPHHHDVRMSCFQLFHPATPGLRVRDIRFKLLHCCFKIALPIPMTRFGTAP